jgi:hypothetical protein
MAGEKSIFESIEDKAKEIGKKVEEILDDVSADEEQVKVTYPEGETSSESSKK